MASLEGLNSPWRPRSCRSWVGAPVRRRAQSPAGAAAGPAACLFQKMPNYSCAFPARRGRALAPLAFVGSQKEPGCCHWPGTPGVGWGPVPA